MRKASGVFFLTGIARGAILNKALIGFVSHFADFEQQLIE
jgi:hypothetical protein